MRFIVSSYSSALSLEHAEMSRELVRSSEFKRLFPNLEIKQDKDTKSNFRIVETLPDGTPRIGGNRYSTSVGGTLTGFHAHILIVDDPLNPKEAVSEVKIKAANHWMEQTLSTRKVDKAITPMILIMQRLHQDDPTGHILTKQKANIRHVCLPGEIKNYAQYVRPAELVTEYKDDLLDPIRMPANVLEDMRMDMGQYGYAGQIGQNPVPPGGGMFQVDHFQIIDAPPNMADVAQTVRYWDKAGTERGGAYTAGVRMSRLKNNRLVVWDCKHGQWSTDERERIIRETAEADGSQVLIYHEQEPGSGGKESAEATTRNLLGYVARADKPTGDKVSRADPYSVQVNAGNVWLVRGIWNTSFIDEHRFFPFGSFKDQVDAASGACAKLAAKKVVRRIV
jgi:predicted phage terminase large subunit-like protein